MYYILNLKSIGIISTKNKLFLFCLAFLCLFISCNNKHPENYYWSALDDDEEEEVETKEVVDYVAVPYKESHDNTIIIPVKINGVGLDMIFDTGASSTCITVAEAQYLYDKGRLSDEDVLDIQTYQTADGKISVGLKVNLREIIVGDSIQLTNVKALVVDNQRAPLLLGQSVLKQFKEVSVDREKHVVKFY